MRTNTVAKGEWQTPPAPARPVTPAAPQPDPEPADLAACLSGPNGLDFVVEMAHDLRSPLTSILFLADALRRGQSGPVNDAQRRALGLMSSAALSLCGTASDVLEFGRSGNRLVNHQPEPFSLSEVLVSVRDMVLPIAEEKQLDVRLVHPVPERRIGHPRAVSRVLLNLATNAVKFTDSGFVEIAARPLTRARVELSVCDTGCGLDANALRGLYQPFAKTAADQRRQFSSSGLGLAICRKLVKAMGADLQVETGRHGTRFFFALELPPAAALS
jgi:signal transduction histidine kinase